MMNPSRTALPQHGLPEEGRRNLFWRSIFLLAGLAVLGVPVSCWFWSPERTAPPAPPEESDPLALVSQASWAKNAEIILVVALNQRMTWIDRSSRQACNPFRIPNEEVSSAAVSPDGQTIVAGYLDGTVAYENRSLATGPVLRPRAHEQSVNKVACSDDGRWLASADGNGSLIIWPMNGDKPWQLRGWESAIKSLAFSPDSGTLAAGDTNGTIRLYDMENQRERLAIDTGHGSVVRLVFAPEGTSLYSVGQQTPRVYIGRWALPSGQPIWNPPVEEPGTAALAVSSDGSRLASGGYWKELVLREAHTGEIQSIIPWFGTIYNLQFSPDGSALLIVTLSQKVLHVYDLEQNRISETIPILESRPVEDLAETILGYLRVDDFSESKQNWSRH